MAVMGIGSRHVMGLRRRIIDRRWRVIDWRRGVIDRRRHVTHRGLDDHHLSTSTRRMVTIAITILRMRRGRGIGKRHSDHSQSQHSKKTEL